MAGRNLLNLETRDANTLLEAARRIGLIGLKIEITNLDANGVPFPNNRVEAVVTYPDASSETYKRFNQEIAKIQNS